jgi:hypothetical protein
MAQTSILPNGSLEDGTTEPTGWRMMESGEWTSEVARLGARNEFARSGSRSIGGESAAGSVVWTSETMALEENQSYRLGGWISASSGLARLEVDLLSEAGATVSTVATNDVEATGTVGARGGWQYAAAEFDVPSGVSAARIGLWVRGAAHLDDVVLVPLVSNMLLNPTFNPVPSDRRQRVQFWDGNRGFDADPRFEFTRERAGVHRVDLEGGRSGSALYMDARRGWWSARGIAMPMPVGATTYRFSGWMKAEKGHTNAPLPEVYVEWLDRCARVLRRDQADTTETVDGWTRLELLPARPPVEAEMVLVSMLVNQGQAWFDDFDLRAVELASNRRPVVRVHVNQVGYEQTWPKTAVVSTNFVADDPTAAVIDIVTDAGNRSMTVPLVLEGRIHDGVVDDWGSYFWKADFSELVEPGAYRLVARIGGAFGESPTFSVGHNVLFESTVALGSEFFHIQRCGFEVFGWHKACHLDGASLPDGTHIDATGGWHSAGDYNKLMYENGDGGCAYSLLAAYRAAPELLEADDRDGDGLPDVLDEARWGADFVAKMQVPETGALRRDVRQGPGRQWHKWSPPEVHTDNIVGTDDDPVIDPGEGSSPLMIGGWARLSTLLSERGIETGYMDHAVRYWSYVTAGGTKAHGPHLMLSSLDMYEATDEERYLDFAKQSVEVMLESQVTEGRRKGAFGVYGEHAAGALATFALERPDDGACERIRSALSDFITFAASTADNSFGLAKQMVGEPEFFFEPTSGYGHNFEILGRAWAGALIFRLTGDRRAADYAADQVDWVMGKNPYGLCMVEGAGTSNPPRYHHRYDSIPGRERGAVPGTVPNGFVRSILALDQPGFDMTAERVTRRRPSYRTSEPWLVHNMWHLMAIAEVSRAVLSK